VVENGEFQSPSKHRYDGSVLVVVFAVPHGLRSGYAVQQFGGIGFG
jgi:hypothetical protein